MKMKKAVAAGFAAALMASAPAWGFSFNDITYWVGDGTNKCAVVVDFNDGSVANSSFAWGYRWNGDAPNVETILGEIAADDPRFTAFVASGWVNGFAYDVDDDGGTFKTGKTFTKSDEDDLFPQSWYSYDDENIYGDDWAISKASGDAFEGLEWSLTDGVAAEHPVDGEWHLMRFAAYAMNMMTYEYVANEYVPTATPAAATRTYRLADNVLWIGHGTNEVGLAISWGVGKTRTWGYRWNGEAPTVQEMIADISSADMRLVSHYSSMGSYAFLDTFGYDAGGVGGVTYDWATYTASDPSAWIAPYSTEYVDPEDWTTWIYHYFNLLTEPDGFYRTGASAYEYAAVGVDSLILQPGTWVVLAYNEGAWLDALDAAEPARSASVKLSGAGTVSKSNTKAGKTATWKAVASAGSVFSHWEGNLVESLNLSANALRNPTLKFKMPTELDEPTAVFLPIDEDGLGNVWLEGDLPLAPGVSVTNLCLCDDSLSYLTAKVTGLPAGMKFNAADLTFAGSPKKDGVYILTVTASNASGYKIKKALRLVVGVDDPEVSVPEIDNTPYCPLTVVVADGGGTVKGTGVYASNSVVTVKATPAKGYVFAGWFDDMGCFSPVEFEATDYRTPTVKVRVPDIRYLVAKFVQKGADTDPLEDVGCTAADETGALTMMVGVALDGSDAVTCESASLPSYSARGLPTGVSLSKTTGAITGVPTKAGTFNAKVTVSNASGKSILPLVITVLPLPTWAQGTFTGLAEQTDEEPGLATLTIGSAGKISGKVSFSGTNWTFAATAFDPGGIADGVTNLTITGTAKYVDAKKNTLLKDVALTVNAPTNGTWKLSSVTGMFGDADYGAHRAIWSDSKAEKAELAENWVGNYRYVTADGDAITLNVQKSGTVKWAGTLANGRKLSGSTTLLHEDAELIRAPFVIAYAPAASAKVKNGKTSETVQFPTFCDIIMFRYYEPTPGGPAERR